MQINISNIDNSINKNNAEKPNNDTNSNGKSNNNKRVSYILIKVPAKVSDISKAIELMGGKREIIKKNAKNDNIELNLLSKPIPLEKCLSNDLLLKKKTKRNKKNPQITKIEYETIGSISSQYDYFAMHDFIYYNDKKASVDINALEKFTISREDYFKELESVEKINQTEKTKIIHNLQERRNKDNGYDRFDNMDITPFFQMNQIAYGRYCYPKVFKEFYEDIDIKDKDKDDDILDDLIN